MEFSQVLSGRRSIRHFSGVPVSDEQIIKLLHAGTLAPSSKNRQQWAFVVLRENKKNRIADITETVAKNSNYKSQSILQTCRAIREADAMILILKRVCSTSHCSDMMSIGACIENICLQAVDLGLGALWICDIDIAQKEIGSEIGRAEPVVAAVVIGYANESPAPRPRLDVNQITEWK